MGIKVQKASFSYNRQSNLVLDEINLKILDDRITGIIGNNASGKSTLLKLMSGLILPTKGKVVIEDMILSRKSNLSEIESIKNKTGYLPQILEESISNETVKNEILAQLEELNVDFTDIDNRIKEVFNVLGLQEQYLDEYMYLLSNGEQRKVAIACILIYNPSIIILDEPTIGLDCNSKKSLINYLTKIKKLQNKTIVIASNDIDFINRISDDVVVLETGKVIKSENKNEIFRDVKFFEQHNMSVPQIVAFEDLVLNEKGIRLGYRDDISDLVKDILRKC